MPFENAISEDCRRMRGVAGRTPHLPILQA